MAKSVRFAKSNMFFLADKTCSIISQTAWFSRVWNIPHPGLHLASLAMLWWRSLVVGDFIYAARLGIFLFIANIGNCLYSQNSQRCLLPWVYAEFARMLPDTNVVKNSHVCRESLPVLPRRKRSCPLRVFRAIADVANYCVVGIFHGGIIFTFFIMEWYPGEINLSIFLTRICVRVVLQTPVFMRHITATIPILWRKLPKLLGSTLILGFILLLCVPGLAQGTPLVLAILVRIPQTKLMFS